TAPPPSLRGRGVWDKLGGSADRERDAARNESADDKARNGEPDRRHRHERQCDTKCLDDKGEAQCRSKADPVADIAARNGTEKRAGPEDDQIDRRPVQDLPEIAGDETDETPQMRH